MKKIGQDCCLWTAKLLLCLLVLLIGSCGSLKQPAQGAFERSQLTLQIAIGEGDLPFLLQRVQEKNLVLTDVQPRIQYLQNNEFGEFLVTFRFVNRNAFLAGRSEIMAMGIARRIN